MATPTQDLWPETDSNNMLKPFCAEANFDAYSDLIPSVAQLFHACKCFEFARQHCRLALHTRHRTTGTRHHRCNIVASSPYYNLSLVPVDTIWEMLIASAEILCTGSLTCGTMLHAP